MSESASQKTGDAQWLRYRRALEGAALPAALVDLDALDINIDRLLAPIKAGGKKLRLATKSVRCPHLIRYIVERAGNLVSGLMTYSATETAFLATEGYRNLLLAYPTVQASDTRLLAELNCDMTAAVVVDDEAQLEALARAALAAKSKIPVVIEVDLAYRPLGFGHLGVRRSPLRTTAQLLALARRVSSTAGLVFHGVMGYEAHIAGLPDASPHSAMQNPVIRAIKRAARRAVEKTRAEIAAALTAEGLVPTLFNGAGTGSLHWATNESALTEVTAGSGFLDSQLFDYYSDFHLEPAAFFALQIVRRPSPDLVTCAGGGYIASGGAGPDRLPTAALPRGVSLLALEGAGEVQTPVRVPRNVTLPLGDPIFFRHAKAGELAEHFNEYLLVREDRIVDRAPTYRGLGHSFLG